MSTKMIASVLQTTEATYCTDIGYVTVLLTMCPLEFLSPRFKIFGADGGIYLFRLLAFALGSCSTLDPLSLWSVDVMSRNPALIICFGARGHRRSIRSKDGDLIGWINLL